MREIRAHVKTRKMLIGPDKTNRIDACRMAIKRDKKDQAGS